jgi:putative endonuclease
MWYVYLLLSSKNQSWYIGCTDDLKNRFAKHNSGKSKYTKDFMPWNLLYYEASLDKADAFRRERYLKSGNGRKWLRNRLKGQIDLERRRSDVKK